MLRRLHRQTLGGKRRLLVSPLHVSEPVSLEGHSSCSAAPWMSRWSRGRVAHGAEHLLQSICLTSRTRWSARHLLAGALIQPQRQGASCQPVRRNVAITDKTSSQATAGVWHRSPDEQKPPLFRGSKEPLKNPDQFKAAALKKWRDTTGERLGLYCFEQRGNFFSQSLQSHS